MVDKSVAATYDPASLKEPAIGVFWVPFNALHYRFHGQVMHMDASQLKIETHGNPKRIVGLAWGCTKEVRYEEPIEFFETEKDWPSMPKINLKYALAEIDNQQIEKAK